jgi:hypothetical protein
VPHIFIKNLSFLISLEISNFLYGGKIKPSVGDKLNQP